MPVKLNVTQWHCQEHFGILLEVKRQTIAIDDGVVYVRASL